MSHAAHAAHAASNPTPPLSALGAANPLRHGTLEGHVLPGALFIFWGEFPVPGWRIQPPCASVVARRGRELTHVPSVAGATRAASVTACLCGKRRREVQAWGGAVSWGLVALFLVFNH